VGGIKVSDRANIAFTYRERDVGASLYAESAL